MTPSEYVRSFSPWQQLLLIGAMIGVGWLIEREWVGRLGDAILTGAWRLFVFVAWVLAIVAFIRHPPSIVVILLLLILVAVAQRNE
jgi:hypothetical protein